MQFRISNTPGVKFKSAPMQDASGVYLTWIFALLKGGCPKFVTINYINHGNTEFMNHGR